MFLRRTIRVNAFFSLSRLFCCFVFVFQCLGLLAAKKPTQSPALCANDCAIRLVFHQKKERTRNAIDIKSVCFFSRRFAVTHLNQFTISNGWVRFTFCANFKLNGRERARALNGKLLNKFDRKLFRVHYAQIAIHFADISRCSFNFL